MSAAVLQGVPVVTHDVDLWIDLPVGQYMQTVNLAARQGATMVRNTVVELSDGMLVNFIYEVTGLGSFATELKNKDPAHIHAIDETLRVRKKAK